MSKTNEVMPLHLASGTGLKTSVIEQLQKIFLQFDVIEKVILYGSRATGMYRPGSDIDLMIEAPEANTQILNQISNMIEDLLLPYQVDLCLKHQIRDPLFYARVVKEGKLFFPIKHKPLSQS